MISHPSQNLSKEKEKSEASQSSAKYGTMRERPVPSFDVLLIDAIRILSVFLPVCPHSQN